MAPSDLSARFPIEPRRGYRWLPQRSVDQISVISAWSWKHKNTVFVNAEENNLQDNELLTLFFLLCYFILDIILS